MSKIRMEKLQGARMAKQALQMVSELVERHGSRLTGSESCKKTAQELQEALESHCDRVATESFDVHPDAFLGWIRILVVLYPISLFFSWISLPIISLLLMSAGAAIMTAEFFLYRETIDRLYPKVEGVNVFGVVEPAGAVKRTVVFSGHHDSARIFNFYTEKPHLYLMRVGSGLGSYVALMFLSLVQTITSIIGGAPFTVQLPSVGYIVILTLLTVAVPMVWKLWNFASKEGTPGAGDNLISSAMAVQIARYFRNNSEQGIPLQHTRVVLASFDAEEAGLRGAREFYRRHAGDETVLQGKVWNFNVDCPYQAKDMFFLTSDINGSIKLSQEMATKCVGIAKSMGYQAFSQPIAFLTGGTDAAEAARAGHEAVSLMAMPWDNRQRSNVYHTPDDLPEAIDPMAVEQTLSIAIRFIEQVDALSDES